MPDEAEPDDPRLADPLHRGQISVYSEEDVDGEDGAGLPFGK